MTFYYYFFFYQEAYLEIPHVEWNIVYNWPEFKSEYNFTI